LEAMMKRDAIKIRLSNIIEYILNEQKKHPTVWYPLTGLQTLQKNMECADDKDILESTYGIEYIMNDQYYDYNDIVFEKVMNICFDIEKLIILRHALTIMNGSNIPSEFMLMKRMLLEWISKYQDNGDILREIEIKYSDEFVKLFNMTPNYWNKIFPEYIKRILSRSSGYNLLNNNSQPS